ncbi:Gfo/Idh/MocA family oxidoreductase [Dehalococcoidia bacterium]|nr:Gfo/Idh/MocA family oxidoreductase [Dehalococcoidia bacterium]
MNFERVRVGIVGAGENVRIRHIPGFQSIEGVELVSVCNRSRESSQRVADEFGIPNVYDNWLDLVEADDTDAICIGTWPYLHCPITIAALESNKHVLTEARMAMNADEAHAMLEASQSAPHLIAQVVPAPMTLWVDRTIQELLSNGYLGDLIAVDVQLAQSSFAETNDLLHWRQRRDLSGYNIMHMGIWYEALMRWIGPASNVIAMTKTVVSHRRNTEGLLQTVAVPDHVDVLCGMTCGAQVHMQFSAVTGLARHPQVWLYGNQGTLLLDVETTKLYGGQRQDIHLQEINIPGEKQGAWRVEEEFINSIRGLENVTLTTFGVGVQYMEFTEAVTRSAQTCQSVSLPL